MQEKGENEDVKEPEVQDEEHGKQCIPHEDRLRNPRQKRRLCQPSEEIHIIPGTYCFFSVCHNTSAPLKEESCAEF